MLLNSIPLKPMLFVSNAAMSKTWYQVARAPGKTSEPAGKELEKLAKNTELVSVKTAEFSTKSTEHGVDFSTVPKVFADPQRMIVPNETHSFDEPRFYAVGHDGHGVLTVRFTLRGETIRVIGAGYWRKQKKAYEEQKKESELR